MVVAKFGGTSVGDAGRIVTVARILGGYKEKGTPVVAVVSAMFTVTDLLLSCVKSAESKKKSALTENIALLKKIHLKTLNALDLDSSLRNKIEKLLNDKFQILERALESMFVLGEASERGKDYVLSFGERLSVNLVAAALRKEGLDSKAINTKGLIITDDNFGKARPDLKLSAKALQKRLLPLLEKGVIPVLTGFIGGARDNSYTTLGRGGSDYSATIIGACLDAKQVDIWKEIDGVMTADPKIVKDARVLSEISYNEAAELSYFGAKVLHPRTIIPVVEKKIPIFIKNSFNPNVPGTKISGSRIIGRRKVKAITAIKDLSLITIRGRGMLGVPGVAAKLFAAVAKVGGNVIFISQASSEQSITFALKSNQVEEVVQSIKHEFELELIKKDIDAVDCEDNVAIVAVVGEGMKNTPGIAGKTFSALGKERVNIVAIAQGSSELNISLAIKQGDVEKAIRAIHQAFNLEKQ